jgi:hypothetical protein
MDSAARTAFILSQVMACQCELEGMKALNQWREMRGESQAYGEGAFLALSARYGIDHDSVVNYLSNGGA